MSPRIVVLGGGPGGALAVNRLRRALPGAAITVVHHDEDQHYHPGLLFVPFGLIPSEEIEFGDRRRPLDDGVGYCEDTVAYIDVAGDEVHLGGGDALGYDVLVIATGAVVLPEETVGLLGAGWMDNVFSFYTVEGAVALGKALARFDGGRLVVNVIDLPITYPSAPLEFCYLAGWYFRQRGIRPRVDICYATPLDDPPDAKDFELVTQFYTARVDGEGGRLVSYDDRQIAFDLAVVVPLQGGAAYIGRSFGLGDELNFVRTDPRTMQSLVKPNIFVIDDAAGIPGVGHHLRNHGLVASVARFLDRSSGEASW